MPEKRFFRLVVSGSVGEVRVGGGVGGSELVVAGPVCGLSGGVVVEVWRWAGSSRRARR